MKAVDTPAVKAGDTLTMTLMKRARASTMAAPVYQWTADRTQPYNMADNGDDDMELCFAKLLTARPDQILGMIAEERDELLRQMQEEGEQVGWTRAFIYIQTLVTLKF